MTATSRPPFRITGWHVLIALVIFFGAIAALDALFITLAYRTFSGQVAKNPYEAGLLYDRTLKQRARQAELGWTVTLSDPADGVLEARFTDRDGVGVDGLSVTGALERPATEAGRRTLAFTPRGEGRYTAPATLSGAWDLRVVAQGEGGVRFEARRRLVTP